MNPGGEDSINDSLAPSSRFCRTVSWSYPIDLLSTRTSTVIEERLEVDSSGPEGDPNGTGPEGQSTILTSD